MTTPVADSRRATALLNWQMGNWPDLAALPVEPPQTGALSRDQVELLLYKMQGLFVSGAVEKGRELARALLEAGVSRRALVVSLLSGAQSNLARSWQALDEPDRAEGATRVSVDLHPDLGDSDPVVALRLAQLGATAPAAVPRKNVLRYASVDRGPIEKNQAHNFAARHALCHYPSGAIYTFIPKNGCTTLRYSLALSNGYISGAGDFEWIHSNNSTFVASHRDLITSPYKFVILRCPFTRLASLFLDKIVSQKDVMSALSKVNNTNKLLGELTFRDFVHVLISAGALHENHHWSRQADFLVFRSYDGWFRLEKFPHAVAEIERNTGLSIKDARGLSKHSLDRFELINGKFADSTASEIKLLQDSGRSPHYSTLYDEDILDEVGQLYEADISIYKFQFGSKSLREDSPVLKAMN